MREYEEIFDGRHQRSIRLVTMLVVVESLLEGLPGDL